MQSVQRANDNFGPVDVTHITPNTEEIYTKISTIEQEKKIATTLRVSKGCPTRHTATPAIVPEKTFFAVLERNVSGVCTAVIA